MNGLEHIIKSETENLQDLTEDAVRHTEELWTKVTDTYNQLRDRGQDFLQSSSTVCSLADALTKYLKYKQNNQFNIEILSILLCRICSSDSGWLDHWH